jgi:PEP-CTERM motif
LSTDVVTNLNLGNGEASGATATTAATGNITGSAEIDAASTLHLGANLNLSGALDIFNGGTVDAHGFGITANQLTVGYFGTSASFLTNTGPIDVNYFFMGNASGMTMHGGDVINNSITLVNGSTLTVNETGAIGLTLNGAFDGALSLDSTSHLDLNFTSNTGPNWDFRWADPASGGNWISTIDSLISSGQIVISSPDGYSVVDQGGYTYVMGGISSVPEPSSLVLAGLATAGIAAGMTWRRRRSSR